jgi:hypothetical protein
VATTRKKLDGPVRSGEWGLTLDRLVDPRTITVLRFADRSRHTRSFAEIGTFGYDGTVEAIAEQCAANSPMPLATAKALARDLVAKVNSPRAREAAVESDEVGTSH